MDTITSITSATDLREGDIKLTWSGEVDHTVLKVVRDGEDTFLKVQGGCSAEVWAFLLDPGPVTYVREATE